MSDHESFVEVDVYDNSKSLLQSFEPDPMGATLEELKKESDRGVVLIGAAYLDELLEKLLRAALIADEKRVDSLLGRDRPLSSFSAKIAMAYCLGLIGPDMYSDLQHIREIRNDCAHRHVPVTFESQSARDRCLQLKSIKIIPPLPPDSGWHPSPRNRFILTIGMLSIHLEHLCETTVHFEVPPIPVRSTGWEKENMPDYTGAADQWMR